MKPYFYGVRDCSTQNEYLLRSNFDDYEHGEIVVVNGKQLKVVTPILSYEVLLKDGILAKIPVLSDM